MTAQIVFVLLVVAGAILLFFTEWLRVDVVALLVLGSLAIGGLVTAEEALSGFSNPAVVTVGAVLILSAGLSRTGMANALGRQVLRVLGQGEVRLMVVIMLTASVLSAFMNDIGVVALLLPVVVSVARRAGHPSSKFLIPLAFGALLGGLNTLIGTPPNILVSEALRQYDLRPFQMFDYTPVGLPLALVGIIFMTLVGRRLLPVRDISAEKRGGEAATKEHLVDLQERLFGARIPVASTLVGMALAESRLGSALGLNVVGVVRDGHTMLAPDPASVLQAGDRLLLVGRLEELTELGSQEPLVILGQDLTRETIISQEIELAEVSLSPRSPLMGQTVEQIDFRRRLGVNVLAIWHKGDVRRTNLQDVRLQSGDTLLVQGRCVQLDLLREAPDFLVSGAQEAELFRLHERLLLVRIPEDSKLDGKTLAESHLGAHFGLTVLGIVRDGSTHLMPEPETRLLAADSLLIEGRKEDVLTVRGLQELEVEPGAPPPLPELESERVGMIEAALSPYSTLHGQTLRQIRFREKYGLNVLAIWREGRAYRTYLRDIPLRFGDALLLYGPWRKLQALS